MRPIKIESNFILPEGLESSPEKIQLRIQVWDKEKKILKKLDSEKVKFEKQIKELVFEINSAESQINTRISDFVKHHQINSLQLKKALQENELFIDIKETQFDRNRLYAGLGFSINESIRVESGYMIQTQKNISRGQLQLIVYNNLPFKNNK